MTRKKKHRTQRSTATETEGETLVDVKSEQREGNVNVQQASMAASAPTATYIQHPATGALRFQQTARLDKMDPEVREVSASEQLDYELRGNSG